MTLNNENKDMTIVGDEENKEKVGLTITEEDAFEKPNNLNKEEIKVINEFYEENKDTIDLIGGIDAFNALLEMPEEQFEILEPQIIAIFKEALNETNTEIDFRTMILEQNYTSEEVEQEFAKALAAIDGIDFLTIQKKTLLCLFFY